MTDHNQLCLDAEHLALREIGPWLATVFADYGWTDSPSLGAVELAVHELANNSVDHADAPDSQLTLRAQGRGRELTVTLTDIGGRFEMADVAVPVAGAPQERGYGLMIIEQIATSLDYRRDGQSNVWVAQFLIESADSSGVDNAQAQADEAEGTL